MSVTKFQNVTDRRFSCFRETDREGRNATSYIIYVVANQAKVFGPKRDEETGEWRKLHNEELNDLVLLTQYCAGGKIETNEMDRACGAYGGG